MTTIGGNTSPVTVEGRGVAVFLMIVGVSLFGFITANIAAFLVAHDKDAPVATLDDVLSKLDSLEREVRAMAHLVRRDGQSDAEEVLTSPAGQQANSELT